MFNFIKHRYKKYSTPYWFYFLQKKNDWFKKKKILLYTDSRGKQIRGTEEFEYYSQKLAKRYSVEVHLCPEKWTTTLDFFELLKKKNVDDYDLIILHTGIVEFSPRPKKSFVEIIYPSKKEMFDETFGEANMAVHLDKDLNTLYENGETTNMYSLQMAKDFILPQLKAIPNLIWIGGNKIVPNWRGNYWRDRPANLNISEDYNNLFAEELPLVVNMMDWTLEEVKKYTFDIIHPNQKGSDIIFSRLIQKIEEQQNKNNV